jgi:centromere/kinetochore protein ZW10
VLQSIQQAALMESLDEAGGFLGTSNENRYAACERALQQVIHTLQRLALVWKVRKSASFHSRRPMKLTLETSNSPS